MNIHKFIFGIAAIIFAVLQPVRANAQGASAPADLHHVHGVQPVADDENEASQEANAKPVMSQLLPDFPGKEVVMMTVTYPPGHSGAVHRHNADGFIYVLEGSVVMGVKGNEPVTVGPGNFKATLTWLPQMQIGKVIEFPSQTRKSA